VGSCVSVGTAGGSTVLAAPQAERSMEKMTVNSIVILFLDLAMGRFYQNPEN